MALEATAGERVHGSRGLLFRRGARAGPQRRVDSVELVFKATVQGGAASWEVVLALGAQDKGCDSWHLPVPSPSAKPATCLTEGSWKPLP